MSEFNITVFGSKNCSPCQSLKEDLESLMKIVDMDVKYFEVGEDTSESIVESMSTDDRNVFKDLVNEHGAGVPLIHVKTDCGETSEQGYGDDVRKIIRMLESIRCDR